MKALVIALQKKGKIVSSSFELITAAREYTDDVGCAILAAEAEALAGQLASRGGGRVLAVSNPALETVNDEIYSAVLSEIIEKYAPSFVLLPATFYGKALVARLAAVCGAAAVSDVTGIHSENGKLTVVRPCYGGSVIQEVGASDVSAPLFASIRPKVFAESSDGPGEVVTESVSPESLTGKSVVRDIREESSGTVSLGEADIIVSAGRGIKGPENVPLVQGLAAAMGAAFGASRAVVDAGWVPYAHQVGQTGRTVNPKLYVAVGISGAIQHLVGMQSSNTIVAINKDKEAPIFNVANYGIVADLFEVVPALTEKFKKELA